MDIVLTDLSKAYDRPVLRGFSLRLREGALTALMAPSGAGKTTLLRILMGLEQPDSGSVAGMEGRKLAAVFQENRLLEHLSPVDNIRLINPALSAAAVRGELARFGLAEAADQPVRELSGGMRRRVALLRALLAEADTVLMDEPFSALDEETRAHVIAETARLLRGRTALLVTHDEEEARRLGAEVVRLV